jgi:hypothetical protein
MIITDRNCHALETIVHATLPASTIEISAEAVKIDEALSSLVPACDLN